MRPYEASHPWITFRFDLQRLSMGAWRLLGQAESKCEHLAGVPLRPEVALRLHQIYLTKGVHGTTSIEGNTLSEAEVLARVQGELPLPPSRAYLGTEIDNVVRACNAIVEDVISQNNLGILWRAGRRLRVPAREAVRVARAGLRRPHGDRRIPLLPGDCQGDPGAPVPGLDSPLR
jgi:hypothetical protein